MIIDVVKKTDNVRRKLAKSYNEFYGHPSEKLFVIGVTGTKGKTTTTNIIHHILSQSGIRSGLIGSSHIKMGIKQYHSNLSLSTSKDVCYYLNKMVEENIKVAILEVSSYDLKTNRFEGVEFDIGIQTNIEENDLNSYERIDDYISCKKLLFDSLSPGKIALINHDDKYGVNLLEGNSEIIVIAYGLSSKSTVTASSIDTDFTFSFNYCLQRGITTISGVEVEAFEYPIKSNLLGEYNIYNVLPAISTCLLLDINIEKISDIIKKALVKI